MKQLIFPAHYQSAISQRQTQQAIKLIKDTFQVKLAHALHLDRVTAPLFVSHDSGLNDDLNGVERKVHFTIRQVPGLQAEVVQSLAKWKRFALGKYGYRAGEGLYTDMNAIRRDDEVDNLHSIFVDQWDWEAVIDRSQRCEEFLRETVTRIVGAVADTADVVREHYPDLHPEICRAVYFVTTQELEDRYPALTPKERENRIAKEHKTVFIMQIGGPLRSGQKHDGRAPDYDDWSLNGDIVVYNPLLDCAFELSSMGIRVDADSLRAQLAASGAEDRLAFPYHRGIVEGTLPLTIGGGIGQSRLCMLLLGKAHIGEVHVSLWPQEMISACAEHGIFLL